MLMARNIYIAISLGALLVPSVAVAQQQPPSGAVRSHYAQPNPAVIPQQTPPQYVPAYRNNQTIAPVTLETNVPEPAPLPPRTAAAAPIPLSPRGATGNKALLRTPTTGWSTVSSVGASLGLVLAAFLCVAWLSKRYLPKAVGPLPKEVVEQLGWAPLVGRQQMQLVRLGNKLLLIAVTPGASAEPLAEVTDQAEVERLSAICRRTKPESSTHAFREVMNELERQPARGFVDTQPRVARTTASAPLSTSTQPRPTTGRPLHG
jgi:flagellar biogenesis protein FliO